MTRPPGRCRTCGAALDGRRPHARYCSPACRREALRHRRLAAGLPDGPYRNLRQYDDRRRKRANRPRGA